MKKVMWQKLGFIRQFHECTTHVRTNGRRKTVVVLHQCCQGHARAADGSSGCQEVELRYTNYLVQLLSDS